ncbi:MAG: HAD-IA family hydrolase [Gammaproteobacteria bacterium]|nr:HAD-IA family hydrolase [Gammaproteobacteria bacterium]
MSAYKLIIFDWDGTLMDSEAKIVNCLLASATDLGLALPTVEEAKNVIGLGLHEACVKLMPGSDHALHLQMADRYRYHFLTANETPSEMFAGVEAMLKSLDDAGHFLAIATGKGRQGLDAVLRQTELKHYFHATRTADETISKPHPQMLHELLDFFGLEANEAIMIGDTEYDLQMATNARMDSLAVSYGVHEVERLMQHQPKSCVHSIEEMHNWLLQK